MLRLSCVLCVFLVCCLPLFAAPACISGNTLDTYLALPTGCMVGPLTVSGFSFSNVFTGGGAAPLAASGITVTTDFRPGVYGLTFDPGGYTVTAAGVESFLIGYTWDPTGPIRGMGDILDPGTVNIITDGCVDFAFAGATCSGTLVSVHVFEGLGTQLTDSVMFSPTSILGIRNNVRLDARGGSATFKSIEQDVFVSEPASGLLTLAGLVILSVLARKTAELRG